MKIHSCKSICLFLFVSSFGTLLYGAGTTIDVLVLYTRAAAGANGGNSGVEAVIDAAIASANTSYANSNVDLELNLVLAQSVTYQESGNMSTDLNRLRNKGDGYLEEAHWLRGAAGADSVCLFTHQNGGSYAGIAFVMNPVSGSFEANAFSVVLHNYAVGNLTFAHELGHNFGCTHARPEASGGGAFDYSFGHRFTGNDAQQYRTVMAYSPGIRSPYFSNPNVNYQGVATGVADSADNAQTISNSMSTTAAFESTFVNTPIDLDDLVWQRSNADIVVWKMSGQTKDSVQRIAKSVTSEWVIDGVADMDSDGKVDFIFRNSNTGKTLVWHMDGKTHTSTSQLGTVGTVWDLVGTTDLNSDTHPDLLWSNRVDGRIVVWYMNGVTQSSVVSLGSVGLVWKVCGLDDFDGDNKPDILWRKTTGELVVWYMDGSSKKSVSLLNTVNPVWQIEETVDMNGDGDSDILWRHNDGRLLVWYMNDSTRTSIALVDSVSTSWKLLNR